MNPFHIKMQKRAERERWRDPLYWQCVHMRGDHTLEREWDRKRERRTVSFPDSPWESNTLPRVWDCVWPPHTHMLHATCVHVHPLLITSTLRSLNPGHTPRRLWCVFSSMCTTIIFFTPPKEWAMGRKALLLRLCFIFCPSSPARQNRFTGTTARFNCSSKETGTKSLSYTTKQHCSLFSVTAHKERPLSVHGGHSVYLSIHSPQMLTLFVAG